MDKRLVPTTHADTDVPHNKGARHVDKIIADSWRRQIWRDQEGQLLPVNVFSMEMQPSREIWWRQCAVGGADVIAKLASGVCYFQCPALGSCLLQQT